MQVEVTIHSFVMLRAIIPLLTIFVVSCAKKEAEVAKLEHLEAKLIAEETSVEPGKSFWVALKLEMDTGWHVNWLNPGDAGLAPTIKWALPDGFAAGKINWPIPQRIPVGDLMLFGYEGSVLLMVEITSPKAYYGDEITLSAACDWVVCGEVCLPGGAILSLTLPVNDETPKINKTHAVDFSSARNDRPITKNIFNLTASVLDKTIHIDFVPISGDDIKIGGMGFFPEKQGIINNAAEQRFSRDNFVNQLEIDRDNMFPDVPENLKGVLVFSGGESAKAKGVFVDVPLKKINFRN